MPHISSVQLFFIFTGRPFAIGIDFDRPLRHSFGHAHAALAQSYGLRAMWDFAPHPSELCPQSYALRAMPSELCPQSYALIAMPSELCPHCYALRAMPSGLCPQGYGGFRPHSQSYGLGAMGDFAPLPQSYALRATGDFALTVQSYAFRAMPAGLWGILPPSP